MALILTLTTKKIFKLHPRQYGFKLTFFGVNHAANIWLWPRTWKEHFLKIPRLTLHVSVFDASFHSRLLFTHFVNLVRFHVEPCFIEFFREKLKITTKRYSYKILSFCLRMEISPFFTSVTAGFGLTESSSSIFSSLCSSFTFSSSVSTCLPNTLRCFELISFLEQKLA